MNKIIYKSSIDWKNRRLRTMKKHFDFYDTLRNTVFYQREIEKNLKELESSPLYIEAYLDYKKMNIEFSGIDENSMIEGQTLKQQLLLNPTLIEHKVINEKDIFIDFPEIYHPRPLPVLMIDSVQGVVKKIYFPFSKYFLTLNLVKYNLYQDQLKLS